MANEKRLCASERDALMSLEVACDICIKAKERLHQRTGDIPGTRRDLGLIASKALHLLEEIYKTVPVEQLKGVRHNMKMCSYTIGVKRPGNQDFTREKDYGLWLSWAQMNALLDACKDHCLMCGLDKVSQAKCPLRKTLDELPNDAEDNPGGGCPYAGKI